MMNMIACEKKVKVYVKERYSIKDDEVHIVACCVRKYDEYDSM